MIDWAMYREGSHQTTIGYTRVELYLNDKNSWRLETYNHIDSSMNLSSPLRTRDLEKAKKRALKFLVEMMTDKRDGIDSWITQMKDTLKA